MIDCIQDIIGVKSCFYKKPYLRDLSQQAGISLGVLDALADEDQIHFLNVLEDIKARGVDRLLSMILDKGIVLNSDSSELCYGDINTSYIPAISATVDNGILLTLRNSKYILFIAEKLLFYSPTVQTVTFIIKDVVFNTILLTSTVDLVQGVNEIPLNLFINPRTTSGEIFIGYNQANVDYYSTYDRDCQFYGCGTCIDSCNSSFLLIQGYPINTKSTYGISLLYSLRCSMEKLICDNSSVFVLPLLYATCIEFIYERLGSDRLNNITLTRQDNYDRLLADYEKSLERSLQGVMKSFNFYDNCCFTCTEKNYISYFKL